MHAAQLPPDALRQRADYYDRIGERHMTPLWEVLGALVPPQPRSPAHAHLWRYAELRDQVMEAGRLISTAGQLKTGLHPWLNIRSARWLRFGSAPTLHSGLA